MIKYNNFFILLLSILFLFSCTSLKKSTKTEETIIRYVNLEAVVNYTKNSDKEVVNKLNKKKKLINTITNIEVLLLKTHKNKKKLQLELKKSKKQLDKIAKSEVKTKKELLNKINISVQKIAKQINADFILNIGDEVIYAKKKYDITEEIIKEYIKQEKKTAPVSR